MAEKKLRGKDFVLLAERSSLMVPICCSRELTISVSADTIEATKSPQSVWGSFLYGNLRYSISSSGLIAIGGGFGIADLYNAQFNRTSLKFIAREGIGSDYFVTGSVIITSVEVSGSFKDMMIMSFNGQGDGPLSRTKILQTFPLVDGDGNTIVDGEGNTIVVAPDQYGTSTPIDISIDC